MRMHALSLVALSFSLPAATVSSRVAASPRMAPSELIGRWDLSVQGANGAFPSWLEVRLSGNSTLVGRFVGQFGSARPVARVDYKDGAVRFAIPPQWEQGSEDLRVEARLDSDRLTGVLTDPAGMRSPFTGVRAPVLRHAEPAWGKPVTLLNGRDLTGWQATGANQWTVVKGILTSATPGSNLWTQKLFTDFKLHVEFRVPAKGNSGIYLRGRHEVQVEDSKGMEIDSHHEGGVYGFLVPNEDAARAPGEWQTYDITFVGRLVTVVLNGRTVIARQEIPGITGGALDSNEGEPGPILIQGDHSSVEYRKIVLTPPR